MKSAIFVIAAASVAPSAYAQQTNVDQPKIGLDSGAGTGIGIAIPRVSIKSDIEGESVKVTLGSAAETYSGAGLQSLTASFTAPFDKDSGSGFLLTDAGLPGMISADVNYTYSFLPNFSKMVEKLKPERGQVDVSIRRRCREKYPRLSIEERQKKCQANLSDVVADLRKVDQVTGSDDLRTTTQIEAENSADNAALMIYDEFEKRQNDAMSSLSYQAFSFSASLGHDTFKHRDATTFAELKPKRTLFSISGAYAFVPQINRPWGFFVGGEYRRKYKLPDKETRCPLPSPGAVSATCFNSAYGPPDRNTDANLFGAIRYDAGVGKTDTAFAFELKATYDAQDNEWGVSLPVYFLKNKEGNLSGGAKVSWDSEKDDVSLGIFVGTVFDFLKL